MINEFELFAPCHFGLEAVLKREIMDLGYEITEVVDGRVSFKGDALAIARCNVFLRTTERLCLGRNLYLRMVSSGLKRLLPLKVNCFHHQIFRVL